MGSPWEHLPADMAREVMEHLNWDRGTSEVFRQVCKGWRDSHDRSATRLRVTGDSLPSSCILMTRFQILKEIGVRFDSGPRFASIFQRTFASLTALTSLDLRECEQVSDNGLHALDGLTALTSLNLSFCRQLSHGGLCSLAGLTALTSLDLHGCREMSDYGLRRLSTLTALTSLNLQSIRGGSDDGLRA
jgi:hypothetical protein